MPISTKHLREKTMSTKVDHLAHTWLKRRVETPMASPASRSVHEPGKDKIKRRKAIFSDVVLEGAIAAGQPGYERARASQDRGMLQLLTWRESDEKK